MNLIIDQGNTVCKIAVFDQSRMLEEISVPNVEAQSLDELLGRHLDIRHSIYSSVGDWECDVPNYLRQRGIEVLVVDSSVSVPLEIRYDRTCLGSDRLAAVVGAQTLSAGRELLVIDAGTAITYERISANGVYLGGNISPGLYLRLKAMHHFTSRLPLIVEMQDVPALGKETIGAMSAGAQHGLIYEIEGYIDSLRREYPDAVVYLTGGDAELLTPLFRQAVLLDADLVLKGLNVILEYNKRIKIGR